MTTIAMPVEPIIALPLFIYGTGSQSDEQDKLIHRAIKHGYVAIDTGPTPPYQELLTARGIQNVLATMPEGSATRLFIQTKISPADRYQDKKHMPFEGLSTPLQQVTASFERSVRRFSESGCVIKALLLHAPLPTLDLTMEFWEAMETLVDTFPDLKYLGICNVTLATLRYVQNNSRIKPIIVQNSFRVQSSFDQDVIEYCRENGLVFQAYSVLTSNTELLSSKLVGWFAESRGISEAQAMFVLLLSFGQGTIRILHASHDEGHMVADLACQKYLHTVDHTILEGFGQLLIDTSKSSVRGASWSY